jgi:hypothetical protein
MERADTERVLNYLISGGVVAYQRAIAHAVGDALAGLLFSQLWYWSGRQPDDREGWFFMTQEQILVETAITRREQETCRRKLRELGILDEELRGHPAKLWYRINVRGVIQLIENTEDLQDGGKRQTRMAENAKQGWRKTPNKDGGKRQPSKNTSKNTSKTSATSPQPLATNSIRDEEREVGQKKAYLDRGRVSGATESPQINSEVTSNTEGADAADVFIFLVKELVAHGVGRSVAETLARSKPNTCKRCLEYLPYVKYRTTEGAWLANAIKDEFGPPAAYVQAMAEQTRKDQEARREHLKDADKTGKDSPECQKRARLVERYGQLEKMQPRAYAAFMEHLKNERARAEHFARNLSAGGREKYLGTFDGPERRLEIFEEWLKKVSPTFPELCSPGASVRLASQGLTDPGR